MSQCLFETIELSPLRFQIDIETSQKKTAVLYWHDVVGSDSAILVDSAIDLRNSGCQKLKNDYFSTMIETQRNLRSLRRYDARLEHWWLNDLLIWSNRDIEFLFDGKKLSFEGAPKMRYLMIRSCVHSYHWPSVRPFCSNSGFASQIRYSTNHWIKSQSTPDISECECTRFLNKKTWNWNMRTVETQSFRIGLSDGKSRWSWIHRFWGILIEGNSISVYIALIRSCFRTPNSCRKSFFRISSKMWYHSQRSIIVHHLLSGRRCPVSLPLYKVFPSYREHAEYLPQFYVTGCFRVTGSWIIGSWL